MKLTPRDIGIVCLLLLALIVGGLVRMARKGWTPGAPDSSMPRDGMEPPPPATP
jgi:hypothetical protein